MLDLSGTAPGTLGPVRQSTSCDEDSGTMLDLSGTTSSRIYAIKEVIRSSQALGRESDQTSDQIKSDHAWWWPNADRRGRLIGTVTRPPFTHLWIQRSRRMWAYSVVANLTLSDSPRPDMKGVLLRPATFGIRWERIVGDPVASTKEMCCDIGIGTLIPTATDISVNEADMFGVRFGEVLEGVHGCRSTPRTEVSDCSGATIHALGPSGQVRGFVCRELSDTSEH